MSKNTSRERRTASSQPDLTKTPQLRDALAEAARKGLLPDVADLVGKTTHDLKPFIKGDVSQLPNGLRGRVIQVLLMDAPN